MNHELRVQTYVERIKLSTNTVFQYCRDTDRLRAWEWPCSDNARVHPSDLQDHRSTHQMLGPCCLCPMVDANKPEYVEAAIYMTTSGPHSGEYVASCASGQCKYFVFIERLYNKIGIPIKNYPRRGEGDIAPPQVIQRRPRPLKRSYAMLDVTEDLVRTGRRNDARLSRPHYYNTVSNLLERLDARMQPGVTEAEFHKLFVKCQCGLITTRRAFKDHVCRQEVIDLTTE